MLNIKILKIIIWLCFSEYENVFIQSTFEAVRHKQEEREEDLVSVFGRVLFALTKSHPLLNQTDSRQRLTQLLSLGFKTRLPIQN